MFFLPQTLEANYGAFISLQFPVEKLFILSNWRWNWKAEMIIEIQEHVCGPMVPMVSQKVQDNPFLFP